MHVRVKNSWIKHLDFIVADLVAINITFLLAYFLRLHVWDLYMHDVYRSLIIVLMILHLSLALLSNFYSGILGRGYLNELKKVIGHNLVLTGLLFFYMFAVQVSNDVSRIMLISFFLLDTILMYLWHIVMKYYLRKRGGRITEKKKVLVVTSSDFAKKAIRKLTEGPDKRFDIIGIALVDNGKANDIMGNPIVARGDIMYEFACRNVVDDVFICISPEFESRLEEITNEFLEMGITVHINFDTFTMGLPNVYVGKMNSARVLTTSINTVTTWDIFLKRTIDFFAGLIGTLITMILFIFIAPAIKIADPKGPVFFGQIRAGKNGRPFKIYKFRSMYADAEERKKELMKDNKMEGLMFKIDADPRIIGSGPDGTKKGLGHFLRATSLDEFPNFWSILKGDMSLVGTRPPTMDEYEKYELHHKSRLAAKPGLTGMWQVSGRSDLTDFEEIVKLDNEYIRNWHIGLDIRIILKTLLVVITRKGSV